MQLFEALTRIQNSHQILAKPATARRTRRKNMCFSTIPGCRLSRHQQCLWGKLNFPTFQLILRMDCGHLVTFFFSASSSSLVRIKHHLAETAKHISRYICCISLNIFKKYLSRPESTNIHASMSYEFHIDML